MDTLAKQIYTALRRRILTGEISQNAFLTEPAVAAEFHASRVPTREALRALCQDELLISYQRKGYLINRLSERQVYETQVVRYQLESLAIEKIIKLCSDDEIRSLYSVQDNIISSDAGHCVPLDNDKDQPPEGLHFHLRLVQLARNQVLYDAAQHYVAISAMAVHQNPYIWKEPILHKELTDALLERDEAKAKKLLWQDLQIDIFNME